MEHKHQIIVEEDEENQTSGQRGDMHSRSESNINKVNEFIPTDINNNSNCGSNSNSNSKQHHHQQQRQQPQLSLFSYNEYCFKQTILNKKHSSTTTTTASVNAINTPPFNNFKPPSTPTAQHQPKLFKFQSNNLHNKSSDSFKPQYITNNNIKRLTLTKNEELITNFLKNCNNLDDIYQPQSKSIQHKTLTTQNDVMYTYSKYNSYNDTNHGKCHNDKKQNVKLNNIKLQSPLKNNNNISTLQLKKCKIKAQTK